MTKDEIVKLGVIDCLAGLQNKKFSAVENVNAFADKVKENKLNAFITTTIDYAVERAKKVDSGEITGKLAGVVFGVKDVFCTKGIRTTCGSKMLEKFVSQYNATIWQKLEDEGAILIGKNNMDEFSMGSSGGTSFFGGAVNPHRDKTRPNENLVPGGSSSGSAVAVADNECNVSVGGDTGGSIRQPASFCGIVGVRPTYGRCSRNGLISYASSLDQAGVLGKSVDDCAYVLDIMSGQDNQDSTMIREDAMNNYNAIKDGKNIDVSGLTIGIPVECKSDKTLKSVNEFWQRTAKMLEKNGAKIKEISIEHIEKSIEAYYTITTAEAFSNLARFDGVRYTTRVDGDNINEIYSNTKSQCFGKEVQRRILTGAYVLSASHYEEAYVRAMKVRRVIHNNFKKAFDDVDILLMPVSPNVAFGFNDKKDPIEMYLNDIYTIPSALVGLAGISVPVGFDDITGLPIGMQLIPKFKDELTMFKFAKCIENAVKAGEL